MRQGCLRIFRKVGADCFSLPRPKLMPLCIWNRRVRAARCRGYPKSFSIIPPHFLLKIILSPTRISQTTFSALCWLSPLLAPLTDRAPEQCRTLGPSVHTKLLCCPSSAGTLMTSSCAFPASGRTGWHPVQTPSKNHGGGRIDTHSPFPALCPT